MRVLEKAVSEHPVVVLLALGAATLALAPGLLSPRFSLSLIHISEPTRPY